MDWKNQIMPRCWNGNTRVDKLEKEKVFTYKMLEAEVSELVQVIMMLK